MHRDDEVPKYPRVERTCTPREYPAASASVGSSVKYVNASPFAAAWIIPGMRRVWNSTPRASAGLGAGKPSHTAGLSSGKTWATVARVVTMFGTVKFLFFAFDNVDAYYTIQ